MKHAKPDVVLLYTLNGEHNLLNLAVHEEVSSTQQQKVQHIK